MFLKKMISVGLLAVASLGLAACGSNTGGSASTGSSTIEVVSREDGSGTRGAFTEITGILQKVDGSNVDRTSKSAIIQNNTEGVISTVAGNANAVGYISLGSLKDTVKALPIDGVEASAATVLDGTYPLQRPFNMVWTDGLSDLGKDFLTFVHSTEGQEIVSSNKFIPAKQETSSYSSQKLSGKLAIVGSTSVAPLMEKVVEAYKALNPEVTVDITANGSSAGITAAKERTADIGMVSRELTNDETNGLSSDALALDGIALIVNKENAVTGISMDQITQVYIGELTSWSDLP